MGLPISCSSILVNRELPLNSYLKMYLNKTESNIMIIQSMIMKQIQIRCLPPVSFFSLEFVFCIFAECTGKHTLNSGIKNKHQKTKQKQKKRKEDGALFCSLVFFLLYNISSTNYLSRLVHLLLLLLRPLRSLEHILGVRLKMLRTLNVGLSLRPTPRPCGPRWNCSLRGIKMLLTHRTLISYRISHL